MQTPPELIGDMVPETPVDQIPEFQRLSPNIEISDSLKDPEGPGELHDLEPKEPKVPPSHGHVPFDHLFCIVLSSTGIPTLRCL